jgi:hypothetical protein
MLFISNDQNNFFTIFFNVNIITINENKNLMNKVDETHVVSQMFYFYK